MQNCHVQSSLVLNWQKTTPDADVVKTESANGTKQTSSEEMGALEVVLKGQLP
jgi:hypothetical protein